MDEKIFNNENWIGWRTETWKMCVEEKNKKQKNQINMRRK